MSDQTLFEQPNTSEAAPADTQETAPAADPYNILLQDIKTGDGRQKFATVSDALTSLPHAQTHISTIESENEVLREELKALKAAQTAADALAAQPNTANGSTQTEPATTAIDVNDIVAQVTAGLSAQEQARIRNARVNDFKAKLVATYGDKAAEVYKKNLSESGLSEKFILDAEAQAPGTAHKFLGLNTNTNVESTNIPNTTRNSQATEQSAPERPTWRPGNQKRPGEELAKSRELTMQRLRDTGQI